MKRICVVGTSGCGKTELSRSLARLLGCPHVELDALHWEGGWREASDEVFNERAKQALAGESWVADGNYGHWRDTIWARLDTLVWLDYSFPTVFFRVIKRTFRRAFFRVTLWKGNRERLWTQLFTRDSLFWWVITTFQKRRREYGGVLKLERYSHLNVLHFRSPRDTERWLSEIVGLEQ